MTVRRNITQPPDWWAAFDKAAQAKGLTLSEWMGQCCRQQLTKQADAKLSQRPPAHRPKK